MSFPASHMTLADFMPPFIGIPAGVILITMLLWALWTYALKDRFERKIVNYFAYRHFLRRRRRNMKGLVQYSMADMEAALQVYNTSAHPGRYTGHRVMPRRARRGPRHSLAS